VTASAPDRVAWIDRQLLAGSDLRLAHRFLDVLRARHLRAAHKTWGVALGLHVDLDTGGESVQVGPGLAYDAAGRDLLVATPALIPIPAIAATAGSFTVALRSAGERCVPQAEVRVAVDDRQLELGRDVPLAEVDLGAGSVDMERRPHVKSLAPPVIRGGTVVAGSVAVKGGRLSFSAEIDTSAAGFQATPDYLVQPLNGPAPYEARLGPLLAVSKERPDGFTLEAHYVFPTLDACEQDLREGGKPGSLPFGLVWLGIEPPPACGAAAAPDPDCRCLL
jgi:hypothetical protein